MSSVTFERRDDGVAVISLNRPRRLNAINFDLLGGLLAAFDRAESDPGVGAVLLRGEGRVFCAGDDLQEFVEGVDEATGALFVDRLQAVTRRIMLGGKPVVSAVQGAAIGAGVAWLLNADVAVAADDATLFCPEAAFGLFPSGGVSILLSERCGPARAAEVLWLGARLTAADLLADGLVGQVVPRAALDAEALAIAGRLAALPPESRANLKAARVRDIAERLEAALGHEAACCLAAGRSPQVRDRVLATLGGGR